MALRWNDGARVQPLDHIEAIELESVMGEDISIAQCNIVFDDGSRLNVRIESDLENDVMIFRGFVLGLIERLGPERRSRISFRPLSPPSSSARVVFISGSLIALIAFLVVGLWAWLSDAAVGQAEWVAVPLFLLIAGMLASIVRSGFITNNKPLDPTSLPNRALPQEPLKVTLARLRQERQAKAVAR
jgi:hypothetical protein